MMPLSDDWTWPSQTLVRTYAPCAVLLVILIGLPLLLVRGQSYGIDFQIAPPTQVSCAAIPPAPRIALPAGGGYTLNGNRVSDGQLRSKLAAFFYRSPEKAVFIAAAPDRRYAELIATADLARGAGAFVVGLSEPAGRTWCIYPLLE